MLEGSSNYAFVLVCKNPDQVYWKKVMNKLRECNVEFRRGTSGGGNQLRQPYLSSYICDDEYKKYPHTEHIHFYGLYIGNYPGLTDSKILNLCRILNEII